MENLLFLSLMSCLPSQSWYSLMNQDGSIIEHEFIAGINLTVGTVTIYLPLDLEEAARKTGASHLPIPYRFNDLSQQDKENLLFKYATR